MGRATLPLVLMCCIALTPAYGAIYSYRDKQGRLYLTDNPPNDKFKIVVTSRKDRAGIDAPAGWLKNRSHNDISPRRVMLPNDEKFSEYINEAARITGVDPYLIKAVIKVESDFDPMAVSPKGAQGLMQLIPSTAELVGCKDVFNPRDNILGGARYLGMMLKRFNGNLDFALAGYNAGPGRVDQYGGVPPFRETQNYLRKVNHYLRLFREGIPAQRRNQPTVAKAIPVISSALSKKLNSAYKIFQNDDIEGAIRAYQEILNIYPRNTQALYNLACLLDLERRFDEAIDCYKAAIKEDPYLDKAIHNKAIIYEKLGMYSEAIRSWRHYMRATKEEERIVMAERYIRELEEYSALKR